MFSTLSQLHQAGAAHLDVSMGNVLLDQTGHAWLIDLENVQLDATEAELMDDFIRMTEVVQSAICATGLDNEAELEEATWQGQCAYLASMSQFSAAQSTSESPSVSSWPKVAHPLTKAPLKGAMDRRDCGAGPSRRNFKSFSSGFLSPCQLTNGKQVSMPKRVLHKNLPVAIRRVSFVRSSARLPV